MGFRIINPKIIKLLVMLSVKKLFFLSFAFANSALFADEEIAVALTWNDGVFVFDSTYVSNQGDSLMLSKFYIYLSSFQVTYNNTEPEQEKDSYHLLKFSDSTNSSHLKWQPDNNRILESISFNIGVDSATNTSGALDGDLDPALGMYWAWHSGYINFKIEGESKSCPTLKHQFQFHIGGFEAPKNMLRSVEFKDIHKFSNIEIDLALLFNYIDLSRQNTITTISSEASEIADLLQKCFKIK